MEKEQQAIYEQVKATCGRSTGVLLEVKYSNGRVKVKNLYSKDNEYVYLPYKYTYNSCIEIVVEFLLKNNMQINGTYSCRDTDFISVRDSNGLYGINLKELKK